MNHTKSLSALIFMLMISAGTAQAMRTDTDQSANTSLFQMNEVSSSGLLVAEKDATHKCGIKRMFSHKKDTENTCSADKKSVDANCSASKADMKNADSSCSASKDHDGTAKDADSKCGAGMCGSDKKMPKP